MDKEKQIAEMARKMCRNYKQDGNCASDDEPCALECVYGYCAERIYCAGYRKSEDVAREIFEEIRSAIEQGETNGDTKIKYLAPNTHKVMTAVGAVYTGEIGKAICQVFEKYTEGME